MHALLLDLDGVLRRWSPEAAAAAEDAGGLPHGVLLAAAFEPVRLHPAILGRASHDEWMAHTVEALRKQYPDADAATSVRRWSKGHGAVDTAVLELVRAVRTEAVPVVLFTNATDRLHRDLAALALDAEVEAVVSSAELGAAKPSLEAFVAALEAAGSEPELAGFVDDDPGHCEVARTLGLRAHAYAGATGLDAALHRWGLLVDPVPAVGGLTATLVRTPDGVRVHAEGPAGAQSWTWPGGGDLPHDALHWIVEGHLGLDDGFWGHVTRGPVHDVLRAVDAAKGDASRTSALRGLRYAEAVVGVLTWADLQPDPSDVAAAAALAQAVEDLGPALEPAAVGRLRGAAAGWARRWSRVPVGGALRL